MESFPKSFKPETYIEMRKLEEETRKIQVETDIKQQLPDSFEPDKTYAVSINGYTTEDVNNAINIIRKIPIITGHDLKIRCSAYKDDNNRFCGEYNSIYFAYYSTDKINKDQKNKIRKIIMNSVKGFKESYKIEFMDKYRTQSFHDIIDELKELGWIMQKKDLWTHIDDDYSLMDLTLIPEL